jgi:clan AA aspartic protease (TIGR02281 family)
MGRSPGFIFSVGLFTIGLALIFELAVPADGDAVAPASPDAVFAQRGLTQSNKWLVLPAESDIHDRVWALRQVDDAVRGTTSTHRSLVPDVIRGREALRDLIKQQDALQKVMDANKGKTDDRSVDNYNTALTQSDVLAAKIIRQSEAIEGLVEREAQVEETRARYIGNLMDAASKAEALAAQYSRLSQDADLTAAISQANSGGSQAIALGPSIALSNDLDYLRAELKKVVSAWVNVRKTSSIGGLHVSPIVNGKKAVEMTWDSGCSDMAMSMETARELGVTIKDSDPTIEVEVANGSKTRVKIVYLDSVQLGPFTLRDVECGVSIDDQPGAPSINLLGNSFQSHFLSRLDQKNGRLQLTPIDSSVEIGVISEPAMLTMAPAPAAPPAAPPAPASPAAPLPAAANDKSVSKPVNLDIARQATATATSTLAGADPAGAIDGVIGGAPDRPQAEWASDEPTGAITLTWDQPVTVGAIKLWDRLDSADHILSGRLVFDDGSVVPFGELPAKGKSLGMRFAARTTSTLRVEILTVSPATSHPGFAEISVFR